MIKGLRVFLRDSSCCFKAIKRICSSIVGRNLEIPVCCCFMPSSETQWQMLLDIDILLILESLLTIPVMRLKIIMGVVK